MDNLTTVIYPFEVVCLSLRLSVTVPITSERMNIGFCLLNFFLDAGSFSIAQCSSKVHWLKVITDSGQVLKSGMEV